MKIAYTSDVGQVRQVNEDRVATFKNKAGFSFAIVADGLGGHLGGEVASEMAVSHLGYLFEQTELSDATAAIKWLEDQVIVENNSILKRADQYQDLAGKFEQITEDHSYVNELVKRGEISKEEAKHHPHKNIITRTLGVSKQAKIDSSILKLLPTDMYLLCSDGLTNMLDDEKIKQILELPALSLQEKAEKLIEQANLAGGSDNITVLIIWSDEEDDEK